MPAGVPFSIQMSGKISYSDGNSTAQVEWYKRIVNASNSFAMRLNTSGVLTGRITLSNMIGGVSVSAFKTVDQFTAGSERPFNLASRHTSTALQPAALGDDLAEVAVTGVADLSSVPMYLGTANYQGTIKLLRIWSADITGPGVILAST